MYVITGATGHVGSSVVEHLLARGKEVAAIGRSAEKLQALAAKGVKPLVGDLLDTAFLTGAFKGATAVFTILPPTPAAQVIRAEQNRISDSIARALVEAGVTHVVNLSSQGAELSEGTGPVTGLHDQEQRLNRINGLNVLHLRATYFMENLLAGIPVIKFQGVHGSVLNPDTPFALIAAADASKAAANELVALNFSGKQIRDLLGQRDVSMNDATRIFGQAIGKPDLVYVQFPYEAAQAAMVGMGMPPQIVAGYMELSRAMNEGKTMVNSVRTPDNTTETPIEAFAHIFAAVYNAS